MDSKKMFDDISGCFSQADREIISGTFYLIADALERLDRRIEKLEEQHDREQQARDRDR